jgi:methyltransferase
VTSTQWFVLLVALVGVERLVELVVSQRHLRWAFAHGALEAGRGHYPAMVVLHLWLLVGSVVEVVFFSTAFLPWLGWPMLAGVVTAQALRWWCIATLGRQWNTRVVVIPGAPRVTSGPYRFAKHPNYVAVVVEGVCLPLVHTAWFTAATFTALNALVMRVRIRDENQALALLGEPGRVVGSA